MHAQVVETERLTELHVELIPILVLYVSDQAGIICFEKLIELLLDLLQLQLEPYVGEGH